MQDRERIVMKGIIFRHNSILPISAERMQDSTVDESCLGYSTE